ncbi:hypothetical protein GGF41_005094, partial [Coemansia sp. RSA 2531]
MVARSTTTYTLVLVALAQSLSTSAFEWPATSSAPEFGLFRPNHTPAHFVLTACSHHPPPHAPYTSAPYASSPEPYSAPPPEPYSPAPSPCPPAPAPYTSVPPPYTPVPPPAPAP